MQIEGTYTFAAPQAVVWPMLQDPQILTRVMPGCEQLETIAENQYQGILKIKVGPVQGTFRGDVTLSDIQPPNSYQITVDGKGAPGFVRGAGKLWLEADGDMTILHYDGEAQVGGRLASVGQRLLDTSAKAIIRQSLEGFGQQIQSRMMADAVVATGLEERTASSAGAESPSQFEFAAGVAKNMLDEFVPEEERPALLMRFALAVGGLLLLRVVAAWWTNQLADKIAQRLEEKS